MSVTFYHYSEGEHGVEFGEAEVNVSNANARLLLAHLGFDSAELVGRLDAADLKARCVLARATGGNLDDSGVATVRDGNMVDCGLRAGYFAEKVSWLEEVADEALAAGNSVTFA